MSTTDFSRITDMETLEAEAISAFRQVAADPNAALWARLRAAENLIRYSRGESPLSSSPPDR